MIDPTGAWRKCEGACDTHRGELRKVYVSRNLEDPPWSFWYCDYAIQTDRDNGWWVKTRDGKDA